MSDEREAEGPSRTVSALAWLIYAFLTVPSLIVVPMSFSASSELVFPPRSWSLGLYRQMLDPAQGWLSSISRSALVALAAVVIALVLAVPAAYGLARSRGRAAKWLEFLFMSPMFIPSIVLALALYICLSYLKLSGSFLGLALSHAVVTLPFVIVTIRSGLKQVDPNIEVAATVMGATRSQVFFRCVLPLLRPSMLVAAFLAFLLSFDEVVIAWFVGASGNPTLPVKMYSSLQWEISPVLTAISTLLLLVTCIASLMAAFSRRRA